MAKTLYIVDGHAHIYAAYFAPMRQRLTSPSGEPTKATYIFTAAVLGLIQRRKPDMLVVAMDSKAPTFRKEIYEDYKAHRPPMPDDMPQQIDKIEKILRAMKIPVLKIDGFEADDIIGTVVKKAASDGIECLICSKDKDLLQLIDKRISTFDIKTDTITDLEALYEQTQLTPEQFVEALALQGDTSDNIPGVPDVGPKTALSWIQKYGSVDNIYKHIDEIKGKRGENLRKFKDKIGLSKTLVTINCEVPLKIDYKELAMQDFDKAELAEIFAELGFNRMITQLNLKASEEKSSTGITTGTQTRDLSGLDSIKTISHDYQLIDTMDKFEKFSKELKKHNVFAIDTETTALDPMRADLVGMSFSFKPKQAFYLPVKVPLGQPHLELDKVRRDLSQILADENVKKIGQNIKYDILVLKNAKMPLNGIYFDTMVASYCLDPLRNSHSMDNMAFNFLNYECIPISALIGKGKNQLTFDMVDTSTAYEYAAEDADITFRLYEYLKERLELQPQLKKLFEEIEMPLVSVLAAMEYNGVSLDTKLFRKMSSELTENLDNITEKIYEYAGEVFNIDSPKQLAGILFDKLNLTSIRVGKTGRSTDAAVLEQIADQHPIVDEILQYRTINKLKNTYVDKLGTLINPKTDRVHASSDPNLQNIPIRTELGRKIRSAFIPAEEGDYILSADYSQIELRLLAHFSDDQALKDAFLVDQDIHSFVASQIFNVSIEQVTSDMRERCKAVNFGIIYGQGPYGLSRTIGIPHPEAKKFINDYFTRYGSIRQFMDEVIESSKKTGYAETILHRRRKIPNLNSKNGNKRKQAERLAVNTVIQGSAADLIKIAMINIQKKIEKENLPVKLILQIHDELVFEVPVKDVEKHADWISSEMTDALQFNVPLKVDISYSPTWLSDK
ncbi:MAG: DNA polymerase I [Planctomycetota bacterium]|jgi:DNA polymerase-1